MDAKEVFDNGFNFKNFLNELDSSYSDDYRRIYGSLSIDERVVQKTSDLDEQVNILIFAQGRCPDCVINIPALVAMQDINSNIKVRIVHKEGNEKHLEGCRALGRLRMPVIVVMDVDYNEIGRIVEIPKSYRNTVERGLEQEVVVARRKYKKGLYSNDMINEVLSIVAEAGNTSMNLVNI